jgi:thiamine transporter
VLSGFIFFSEYAPEGQSAVLYSIIYNGTFMSVETAITILLAIPILAALGRAGKLKRE